MTANNSIFDSSAGIETSTSPAAPSIFDSTGGIMSTGGPPPAATQITWGDGTNVTSGDGTNTTWSA